MAVQTRACALVLALSVLVAELLVLVVDAQQCYYNLNDVFVEYDRERSGVEDFGFAALFSDQVFIGSLLPRGATAGTSGRLSEDTTPLPPDLRYVVVGGDPTTNYPNPLSGPAVFDIDLGRRMPFALGRLTLGLAVLPVDNDFPDIVTFESPLLGPYAGPEVLPAPARSGPSQIALYRSETAARVLVSDPVVARPWDAATQSYLTSPSTFTSALLMDYFVRVNGTRVLTLVRPPSPSWPSLDLLIAVEPAGADPAVPVFEPATLFTPDMFSTTCPFTAMAIGELDGTGALDLVFYQLCTAQLAFAYGVEVDYTVGSGDASPLFELEFVPLAYVPRASSWPDLQVALVLADVYTADGASRPDLVLPSFDAIIVLPNLGARGWGRASVLLQANSPYIGIGNHLPFAVHDLGGNSAVEIAIFTRLAYSLAPRLFVWTPYPTAAPVAAGTNASTSAAIVVSLDSASELTSSSLDQIASNYFVYESAASIAAIDVDGTPGRELLLMHSYGFAALVSFVSNLTAPTAEVLVTFFSGSSEGVRWHVADINADGWPDLTSCTGLYLGSVDGLRAPIHFLSPEYVRDGLYVCGTRLWARARFPGDPPVLATLPITYGAPTALLVSLSNVSATFTPRDQPLVLFSARRVIANMTAPGRLWAADINGLGMIDLIVGQNAFGAFEPERAVSSVVWLARTGRLNFGPPVAIEANVTRLFAPFWTERVYVQNVSVGAIFSAGARDVMLFAVAGVRSVVALYRNIGGTGLAFDAPVLLVAPRAAGGSVQVLVAQLGNVTRSAARVLDVILLEDALTRSVVVCRNPGNGLFAGLADDPLRPRCLTIAAPLGVIGARAFTMADLDGDGLASELVIAADLSSSAYGFALFYPPYAPSTGTFSRGVLLSFGNAASNYPRELSPTITLAAGANGFTRQTLSYVGTMRRRSLANATLLAFPQVVGNRDLQVGLTYSVVAGDYDNDGWADLFVTADSPALLRNVLGMPANAVPYGQSILTALRVASAFTAALFFDWNGDGALDLAVTRRFDLLWYPATRLDDSSVNGGPTVASARYDWANPLTFSVAPHFGGNFMADVLLRAVDLNLDSVPDVLVLAHDPGDESSYAHAFYILGTPVTGGFSNSSLVRTLLAPYGDPTQNFFLRTSRFDLVDFIDSPALDAIGLESSSQRITFIVGSVDQNSLPELSSGLQLLPTFADRPAHLIVLELTGDGIPDLLLYPEAATGWVWLRGTNETVSPFVNLVPLPDLAVPALSNYVQWYAPLRLLMMPQGRRESEENSVALDADDTTRLVKFGWPSATGHMATAIVQPNWALAWNRNSAPTGVFADFTGDGNVDVITNYGTSFVSYVAPAPDVEARAHKRAPDSVDGSATSPAPVADGSAISKRAVPFPASIASNSLLVFAQSNEGLALPAPAREVRVQVERCGYTLACVADALLMAQSCSNDRVLLPVGTYGNCFRGRPLMVHKTVTLASEDPTRQVVIDCSLRWGTVLPTAERTRAALGRYVLEVLGGATVTIERVAVRNAFADATASGGAAFRVSGAGSTLVLRSSAIANCLAYRGTASALRAGASGFGPAVLLSTGGSLVALDTSFTGNTAEGSGGAVALVGSGSVSCTRCAFVANMAAEMGGAVYAQTLGVNNSLVLVNTTLSGNSVASGAGGALAAQVTSTLAVTLARVTVSGNAAPTGGALFVETSAAAGAFSLAVDAASAFVGNTASTGDGGALALVHTTSGTSSVAFAGSASGNTAAGYGGAAYVSSTGGASRVTVALADSAQLIANSAGKHGGAFALSVASAGALSATVGAARFAGNVAGGMGGALALIGPTVTGLTGTQLGGNRALWGGAIGAVGSVAIAAGLPAVADPSLLPLSSGACDALGSLNASAVSFAPTNGDGPNRAPGGFGNAVFACGHRVALANGSVLMPADASAFVGLARAVGGGALFTCLPASLAVACNGTLAGTLAGFAVPFVGPVDASSAATAAGWLVTATARGASRGTDTRAALAPSSPVSHYGPVFAGVPVSLAWSPQTGLAPAVFTPGVAMGASGAVHVRLYDAYGSRASGPLIAVTLAFGPGGSAPGDLFGVTSGSPVQTTDVDGGPTDASFDSVAIAPQALEQMTATVELVFNVARVPGATLRHVVGFRNCAAGSGRRVLGGGLDAFVLCESCPLNTITTEPGVVACTACPDNSYNPAPGATSCLVCPARTTATQVVVGADGVARANCTCVTGTWARDGALNVACDECPAGAVCAGGTTAPRSAAGFFPTTDPALFVPCPVASACQAGSQCAVGYTGRLCGRCVTGYYALNQACFKCAQSQLVPVMIAILIGAFLLVFLLVALNLRRESGARLAAVFVALQALQIMGMLGQLQLGWPSLVRRWFNAIAFVSLNLEVSSPECATRIGDVWLLKFFLTCLLPVLFVVPFATAYCGVWAFLRSGRRLAIAGDELTLSMTRSACQRGYAQLMLLLYMPLTAMSMSYFRCRRVGDGTFAMDAAPSRACFDSLYWTAAPAALAFVLLYAFGIPAALALTLRRLRRRAVAAGEVSTWELRYGFLVAKYTPAHYWFESWILARGLGVVLALTVFLTPYAKAGAAYVVLVASLAQLLLQRPYRTLALNCIAAACLGACALLVLAVQFSALLAQACMYIAILVCLVAIVAGIVFEVHESRRARKDADRVFGSGAESKSALSREFHDDLSARGFSDRSVRVADDVPMRTNVVVSSDARDFGSSGHSAVTLEPARGSEPELATAKYGSGAPAASWNSTVHYGTPEVALTDLPPPPALPPPRDAAALAPLPVLPPPPALPPLRDAAALAPTHALPPPPPLP